jgi:hypothetical protein
MLPELELLRRVKDIFERLGIFYFVTGSIASITYGEPRTTNDIDIVASIQAFHVRALCEAFQSPEFYMSEDAARDAVRTHFQFNILHPSTGLKVDVIIPGETEFDRNVAKRVLRLNVADDLATTMISPEDVVLHKLLFYCAGESDKHLRDIAGVMRVHGVDREYITSWADKLEVRDIWEAVVKRESEAP